MRTAGSRSSPFGEAFGPAEPATRTVTGSPALSIPVVSVSGVILAALSAHGGDAALLAPASSMLLFHASAVLGAVALVERGTIHARFGLVAATGFVAAALLIAGDAHGRTPLRR